MHTCMPVNISAIETHDTQVPENSTSGADSNATSDKSKDLEQTYSWKQSPVHEKDAKSMRAAGDGGKRMTQGAEGAESVSVRVSVLGRHDAAAHRGANSDVAAC